MTAKSQIKEELINRIDKANNETVSRVLDFLNDFEEKSKKERILSFSGIWKNLDEDLMKNLTEDLPARRNEDIRFEVR